MGFFVDQARVCGRGGRRIAAAKNYPRSTYFSRQRLSIVIQREKARLVLSIAIQRGNDASVLGQCVMSLVINVSI